MRELLRNRRRLALLVPIVALGAILVAFLGPPPVRGRFPPTFTEPEKRQIISAANHEALRQALTTLVRGRFTEAQRWILLSSRQTVREVEKQPEGRIWVTFETKDATAPQGQGLWAQYSLTRNHKRWVIDKPRP